MDQVCDLWVAIFGLSGLTQASERGLGELIVYVNLNLHLYHQPFRSER